MPADRLALVAPPPILKFGGVDARHLCSEALLLLEEHALLRAVGGMVYQSGVKERAGRGRRRGEVHE
jgi:hypothetical protein